MLFHGFHSFPFLIFLFLFTLTFESRASVNPSQPTITCHISAALFFFGITYFYIFFCILIFSINPSKPGIACHISAALAWHSSHYIAAAGQEALKSNAKKLQCNIISEIYSNIMCNIYSNIIYWTLTFCLTPVDNGEQIPNHYSLQEKNIVIVSLLMATQQEQ